MKKNKIFMNFLDKKQQINVGDEFYSVTLDSPDRNVKMKIIKIGKLFITASIVFNKGKSMYGRVDFSIKKGHAKLGYNVCAFTSKNGYQIFKKQQSFIKKIKSQLNNSHLNYSQAMKISKII